jgi:hypothetical protein
MTSDCGTQQGSFIVTTLYPLQGVNTRSLAGLTLLCLSLLLSTACSDNNGSSMDDGSKAAPFAELVEQGVTRYLGMYSPMLSEQKDDVTNYYFAAGDGPVCAEGAPYSMATRDQGSEDLMIFLEGGGACWSDFCFYVSEVTPGIPRDGLLDPARDNNPFKNWSQVYVPYCDGSLHAGDIDVDTNGDGQIDRYQHGLHNLSAALDVAVRTFPAPRKILLAGQSGGGFGTIFALPLVRQLYPGVPIDVVNDSGVGVLKPDKPEFLEKIIAEWNIGAFIPASCPECLPADGHLTDYLIWQMDQDPNVKRGLLSYSRDANLSDLFLAIGGDAFEQALVQELQQQEDAHPQRTHYWLVSGSGHTFVELEPDRTAGGVPLMAWIGAMVTDSGDWVSARDTDASIPL